MKKIRLQNKEAKVLLIVLIVSLALVTMSLGSYSVVSRYMSKARAEANNLKFGNKESISEEISNEESAMIVTDGEEGEPN